MVIVKGVKQVFSYIVVVIIVIGGKQVCSYNNGDDSDRCNADV